LRITIIKSRSHTRAKVINILSQLVQFNLIFYTQIMSTRIRNPEVYVKGYGKSVTKDDLKSWFKDFGKIVCIQYKGPYAFIVLLGR